MKPVTSAITIFELLEPRVCLAISFTAGSSLPPGRYHAVGDLTGDNVPDLVTYLHPSMNVHRGTGNAKFEAQPFYSFFSGVGANTVDVVDLDHDGRKDILYMGSAVGVVRNLGNGQFSERHFSPSGNTARSMILADFNRDGDVDILSPIDQTWSTPLSPAMTFGAALHLGTGDAWFQPPLKIELPGPQQMIAASATGLHVALGGRVETPGGYVSLVHTLDLTQFDSPVVRSFRAFKAEITGLGFGDVNGDQLPDVVAQHAVWPDAEIDVFLATGSDGYALHSTLTLPWMPVTFFNATPTQLALHDFDLDGKLDIFFSGWNPIDNGNDHEPYTGAIGWLRGNGTGSFDTLSRNTQRMFGVSPAASRHRLADVNSDGKIDIIYSRSVDGGGRPLINISTVPPAIGGNILGVASLLNVSQNLTPVVDITVLSGWPATDERDTLLFA